MKNILKILVVSLILVSCNKEDDSIGFQKTKLFSISLPDGFYRDNPDQNVKTSGHVFLTDDMGKPIIDRELSNNTTTELITEFDTDNKFDVTFLQKTEYLDENGKIQTNYNLKTFANVSPYILEFLQSKKIMKSKDEEIEIIINNTNGYLEDFIGGSSYGTTGGSNRTEYRTGLGRIPANIYFSFKHEEEELRRYVLLENLTKSSVIELEYSGLPVIEEVVTINYPEYPEYDLVWIGIYGALSSDPNYFFAPLAREIPYTGGITNNFNIPVSLFNKFRVITRVKLDNESFFTDEISNHIDNNYTKPNLSFQVLNNSIQNYEISSSSVFDYYSIYCYYNNDIENYSVNWSFYGQSQNNIKLTKPNILNLLDIGNTTPSFNDFKIPSTSLKNVEGINSYKDYIISVIDPNSKEAKQIIKQESISK